MIPLHSKYTTTVKSIFLLISSVLQNSSFNVIASIPYKDVVGLTCAVWITLGYCTSA